MLVFERFHLIFKKLVQNSKLSCMNASIAGNYSKLLNADFWNLRRGGVAAASSAFQSTISGSVSVDWESSSIILLSGATVKRTLTVRELAQLQDMHAVRNERYSALRHRYRQEMKTYHCRGSQRERKRQRKAYDKSQLPAVWVPRCGSQLTSEEQSWLSMVENADVECVKGAKINGKFTFRTRRSEETNATDNSVVKAWRYSGDEDENKACYAWIVDMFIHQMHPGGPAVLILEGNWLDVLPNGSSVVGLPVVRENYQSYFNNEGPFFALVDCAPYNLVLLPNDLSDQDCRDYSVVDREY